MNRIMGQGKAFMPLRLDVGLKKRVVEAEMDARMAHLYELTKEENFFDSKGIGTTRPIPSGGAQFL